ncbi:MAG: hypothetical protein P9L92_06475 [Candidatus Electryonea clarkiae]|nr:hypothetical protein [Candidatus Electryonea clarkiae]MDP8286353.1 hypothetical protein [Candidatus Electryonea clarkiae]
MSKKMLPLILGLVVVLLFGSIGTSTEHYYIVALGLSNDVPPEPTLIVGAEADYIMRYTVTWPTTWNPGETDYNGHREIEVEDAPIEWKSYCAHEDWEFDFPTDGYSDPSAGTVHAYTHYFQP